MICQMMRPVGIALKPALMRMKNRKLGIFTKKQRLFIINACEELRIATDGRKSYHFGALEDLMDEYTMSADDVLEAVKFVNETREQALTV